MMPRPRGRGWLPSVTVHARSIHALATYLLALLCLISTRAIAAESDVALRADTGLRVISGASFRAFSNRFRRHLHGKHDECLGFHEADTWWRYEWCVGHHVRQFHVTADGDGTKNEWSIVLGRFASDASKTLRIVPVEDPDASPSRRELMGYIAEQDYVHGDECGLGSDPGATTPTPRHVSIQYKCCVFRANETYIESVEEPTQCTYTLAVCTPVACGLAQKDQYVFGVRTHVTEEERLVLVQTVKDMFYHAYHGYMDHAFPFDTLLPISCRGETFELGKMQLLTLIDTLDTLAILEDAAEFQRAVHLVVQHAEFNLNTEVSVFETTIRVLGGLLSAHLFAVDKTLGLFPPNTYKNELLELAVDLTERLMPAFNTTTGIPYGTVNLRHGVPRGETPIASTAGAGSLTMEFTMLSVLTGDARYANASRRAVRALFDRRSRVGLLGKHIDTRNGEWTETMSGPGSNADSFYEYLWKMYVAFHDREMLDMFDEVYAAVLACNLHGDWFADVSMWSGCGHSNSVVFENLAAFWPGMQATLGHVGPASRSMNAFYRVWREYGFVPEQFNVLTWKPLRGGAASYPLRPELIESTFYMHEATNDSSWLRAGAHFVHSLQKHTKTKCGYATVKDIETKQLDDSMPSFFLSETCKYLYLLFNTTHFVRNGKYVMTTEAHPFPILPTKQVAPVILPTLETPTTAVATPHNRQCARPVFWRPLGYQLDYRGLVLDKTERCARPTSAREGAAATKPKTADDWLPVLEKNLREQLERLAGKTTDTDTEIHTEDGVFTQELLDGYGARGAHMGLEGDNTFQYIHGGGGLGLFRIDKMDGVIRVTRQDTGEWLETSGIDDARFKVLTWLPERRGFSKSAEAEATGADEDDELPLLLPRHRVYDFADGLKQPAMRRLCHLYVEVPSATNPSTGRSTPKPFWFSCVSSSFGATPPPRKTIRFPFSPLVFAEPLDACGPLSNAAAVKDRLVMVKRGECFFETKARHAAKAGAVGVVVVNNEEVDRVMVMSGSNERHNDDDDDDDDEGPGDDREQSVAIPVVMVPRRVGEWFHRQSIKTNSGVYAEIELTALDRQEDLDEIAGYVDVSSDGASEEAEVLRRATRVYPRMEYTPTALQVLAPTWGLQLTPVRRKDSPVHFDWSLEIIAKKQTVEDASKFSP